jgi:PAS domain S-box-containing protein
MLNTLILTRALAESLDAHRLLMEHASDGIVLADSGGRITAMNERARELLGCKTAAMLGRSLMEVVTDEGCGPLALDRLRAGETLVRERSLLRTDGLRITLECSVRLIGSGTGGSTIQAIMRDISERRRVERERLRAQRMELMGLLAGGISHDFNNVMAIIMNNMELARMRTPQEVTIYIDRALEAVHRGRALVEGLLRFSSGVPSGREHLDIGAIASEIAGLMSRQGGAAGRRVAVRVMPGLWGVEGHADEMRQIVMSLCQQALAVRGPVGGGAVLMELDNVEVPRKYRPAGGPHGEFVRLRLPDEAGDSPERRRSIPTGIVTRMGGWIEGEDGAAHIYFPRSHAPEAKGAPSIPSSLAGGSETILLVEDETHLAEATTDMLELLGYRVHAAPDAESALALYRRMEGGVDLVITDFLLPNASGLDLVREVLRERPGQAAILTTGHAASLRDLSFPAEARVSVLLKPYNYESLASLVRETLGGHSEATPLRRQLNRVRLSMVRENAVPHTGTIANTADVYELFKHLADSPREKFVALFLDAAKKIIGYDELAQGTANEVVVYPQEVVRSALLANAAAVILVHNHPTGGTAPSDRDMEVTRQVVQACSLFAIDFLDHVIIGRDGFFAFTAEVD